MRQLSVDLLRADAFFIGRWNGWRSYWQSPLVLLSSSRRLPNSILNTWPPRGCGATDGGAPRGGRRMRIGLHRQFGRRRARPRASSRCAVTSARASAGPRGAGVEHKLSERALAPKIQKPVRAAVFRALGEREVAPPSKGKQSLNFNVRVALFISRRLNETCKS